MIVKGSKPQTGLEKELFFALVGPIGTDLPLVTDALSKELEALGYHVERVKMSKLLEDLPAYRQKGSLPVSPENVRIESLMRAGDRFRRETKSGAALAYLSTIYVRERRKTLPDKAKRAFIFDSLKHPEELRALRKIYEDSLVCISVFAPRTIRVRNLAYRIAKTKKCSPKDCTDLAKGLIDIDERSSDKQFGQNVADTFPMADAFIRHGAREAMTAEIARLVELLFGHTFRTPTRDEVGMFHARAASLRSADLSRQVGAVLADLNGSILAAGCNEVPRAGGGTYWEGDDPDDRDFRRGRDANVAEKLDALRELFTKLAEAKWLSAKVRNADPNELAERATTSGGVLDGSRVDSLIEFGRVVHAEMNALMDAVARGVAVRGATLFCTTFPCHNCARHLLAAGVRRVVYIEPYPKSLAVKLYEPAIRTDDEPVNKTEALTFEAFMGVAPRKFLPLFDLGAIKRKEPNGFVRNWNRANAEPRFSQLFATHREREQFFAVEFVEVAARALKSIRRKPPQARKKLRRSRP